jgi:hypothetical protein
LGDVYDKLAQLAPEEWRQRFARHDLYRKYVERRLPAALATSESAASYGKPRVTRRSKFAWRQLRILTSRYLTLQCADVRSLVTMFGQCVLVAWLLVIFYGNLDDVPLPKRAWDARNILFLMTISCLWFGCNNSAKEIVKERVIFLREKDVNLDATAYYVSKLLLLGAIGMAQAALLLATVRHFTHLSGDFIGQLGLLMALAGVGVSLGLFISSVSKSNDHATGIVPAVLIPQIILAGVIAPVSGTAKFLAQSFVSAYWGYRGLAAILPGELRDVLGADDWSSGRSLLCLGIHFLVLVFAGLWALSSAKPTS